MLRMSATLLNEYGMVWYGMVWCWNDIVSLAVAMCSRSWRRQLRANNGLQFERR